MAKSFYKVPKIEVDLKIKDGVNKLWDIKSALARIKWPLSTFEKERAGTWCNLPGVNLPGVIYPHTSVCFEREGLCPKRYVEKGCS